MKKKVIGVIVGAMTLTMAFSACGSSDSENVASVDFNSITENATESTKTEDQTTTTTETTVTETVEEENHEGMYRSELTNEWISEDLENQRPIAVMVDNEKTALPHYGLTEADVVYEMMNSTENNRITRFMALVKDWGAIEQFGSIRSTRPTNVILAMEWNAVLCHDGGPFYINEYLAYDESNNFSGTFSRVNNGKSREFTEYICTGDLETNFANSGYSTDYNEYYQGEHFKFSDDLIDLADSHSDTDTAKTIELPFPHNSSTLKWNDDTTTYDYYEYGEIHTDPQHDDAVLTFENVILQNCNFAEYDENGYLVYYVVDSGEGYYITEGKAIEITWTKSDITSKTVYFDKATGKQLEMNTGKTYIAIVPSDSWDDVVIK